MTMENRRRFFSAVFGGSRRDAGGKGGSGIPGAERLMPPAVGQRPAVTQASVTGGPATMTAGKPGAAGDPMVFDVVEADLGAGLPEGMALLTVVPFRRKEETPGFRLRGVCCCGEATEFAEVYGKPDLDLGSLVSSGGELPADVLSFMQIWSRPKTELTRWLDRRLAVHGDRFQLVIWDDTGYRIPWELFWLEYDSGRAEGWLGGVVTITRWLSIRTAWPETVRDYRSSHECTGSVAAYIDPEMNRDHSLLTGYRVEPSSTMYDLTKALKLDGDALALVYVACHGKFGEQLSECALGTLPLLHVDPMKFPRLRPAATFVFLNACHSGSLGYDTKRFNDRVLRGFSEVFLRSGAAGVLATNGAVGDGPAHEMARELLQHLRDNPGRSVAEAVRDLRAKAAGLTPADLAAVAGPGANRELLPLLYRFMYVCYGSPRTLVSPDAAKGAP
ncbi:CHAT domain-containing protein [Sphaerisporangium viridialbum]|uniref:CHAT domain-containing protein n=1 Tax=Sphaerisporangium viridialbum TaxID=46189 RepID=UPI003C787C9D